MKNSEKIQVCRQCLHWTIINHRPTCGVVDQDIHRIRICPDGKWAVEPGVMEKAGSFGNAQLGLMLGETVSEEEYQRRRLACFGAAPGEECGQLRRRPDGRAYCGLCGCGSRDEVLLDEPNSKLKKYARITCKLNRF
jgi:hypothetical protein